MPKTINGTTGADSLVGTLNRDLIQGGESADNPLDGADTIRGLGGNDTIFANSGDDRVDGGDGNDQLQGEAGIDTLIGAAGDDWLGGGDGDDLLLGGEGNDQLAATAGANRMLGGVGHDYFYLFIGQDLALADTVGGGQGVDTLRISGTVGPGFSLLDNGPGHHAASNTGLVVDGVEGFFITLATYGDASIQGGSDNDFISLGGTVGLHAIEGRGGSDNLVGDSGDDRLLGGEGNDQLLGYGGFNTLRGGAGNDVILGGTGAAGRDHLRGGDGDDYLAAQRGVMWGGAGADTFHFEQFDSALHMTIADFTTVEDRIEVQWRTVSFLLPPGPLDPAALAFDAPDRAAAQLVYDTATGVLAFDSDGTGAAAAQQWLLLRGAPALAAGDIHVI